MNILINGKSVITDCSTLYELRDKYYTDTEENLIVIFNGFQTYEDFELNENDNVSFIIKGQMPNRDEFEA